MNHLFIEDSGNDSDSPFQVTKGNKISAKTAISRNLKALALITRTASVYRLLQVEVPLGRVATLTGFEPVSPP